MDLDGFRGSPISGFSTVDRQTSHEPCWSCGKKRPWKGEFWKVHMEKNVNWMGSILKWYTDGKYRFWGTPLSKKKPPHDMLLMLDFNEARLQECCSNWHWQSPGTQDVSSWFAERNSTKDFRCPVTSNSSPSLKLHPPVLFWAFGFALVLLCVLIETERFERLKR